MPEQTDLATDDRKSEMSREVWQARDEISTEGRIEARNVIIIAGALAAFTMAAFGNAQGVVATATIGVALIVFLLAVLIGVFQMAHNLSSTHGSYTDLLLWLDERDEDARRRYDKQKAKWKAMDQKKKRLPFSIPEICMAIGIVLLIGNVIFSIVNRTEHEPQAREPRVVQSGPRD